MKQSMGCEERVLASLRVYWKTRRSVYVLKPLQMAVYYTLMKIHGVN